MKRLEYPFSHTADEHGGCYTIGLEDGEARLEYVRRNDTLHLTHTYVPPKYEGRGVATQLIRSALEDIRDKGLRIVPRCSFVLRYIERHPEWEAIVHRPERRQP